MQEQNPIVLMNFSGIYREEEFWKNRQVSWIELQDVCGTNCYCDEEAIAEINKRTENYPTAGIHFIDSGNYHYMTRLWLTRMDQPFCLLVYDNHTDMQPPAFGGILSCGGWIAAALEVSMTNPVIMWDRSLHRNLWMRHLMSRETVQEMKVPQMTRVLKLQKMEKVIHHMTTETQMIQMDMVIIQKITVIIRGMILRDIDSIWKL